nr:MAG TPA: hypothetical protein [Caudoviricetes sp.]
MLFPFLFYFSRRKAVAHEKLNITFVPPIDWAGCLL